jgi:hypothetical protein
MHAWKKYAQLQFDVLSRSDVSFKSIHDPSLTTSVRQPQAPKLV